MRKKERAEKIQLILNSLFPHPEIPLKHEDPYTLLISVLLSAQCTDKRVNEVTPFLFSQAKTPEKMMQLDIELIESIIRPCGLSKNKSKAISQLSQILVKKYHGVVPKDIDALESLPGVGHKTASVVMCQAFNIPAFPVDTHIYRCSRRWKLSSGENVKKVEEDLKKIFPKKDWIQLHLQMIYFARQYCPAKNHNDVNCPICMWIN